MSSLSPSLATSSHNNESSSHQSNNNNNDDDHWDNLRQLVSDFHNHVYVELPTILEHIRDVVADADADADADPDFDNSSIISSNNNASSSSQSQSQSQSSSQSSSSRILPSYQHQHNHNHNHGNNQDDDQQTTLSRHYFELRRCLRNIREILMRDDLMDLLEYDDFDDYYNGYDESHAANNVNGNINASNSYSSRSNNNSNDNSNNCYNSNSNINSNNNDDARLPSSLDLIKIFADDIVQLVTMSDFDNNNNNDDDEGALLLSENDPGVCELYRSLIVLATNRFPSSSLSSKASGVSLDTNQTYNLLSKVLSLIQCEITFQQHQQHQQLQLQQQQQQQQQQDYYQPTNNQQIHQSSSSSSPQQHLLQCLLSWLNQELTLDELQEVVGMNNNDDAVLALQVPLELLELTKSTSSEMSTAFYTLPDDLVLSLRILINSLMEMLKSIVVVVGDNSNNNYNNNNNSNSDSNSNNKGTTTTCTPSPPLPLRGWLSTAKGLHHQHCSNNNNIDHRYLLQLIDRYGLQLVETTLELLRPQKQLPHRQKNGFVATAATISRKRDRSHDNYDNDDAGGEENINNNDLVGCSHPTPMTQKQRIVKVLQHITMSTNFFLVMEDDDDDDDVSNNATNNCSSHGNVLAGLSRTLWRALARFVIEEVDRSQNDDDDNEEEEEEYNDNEDCQIAATDVLFRLTKHQVHNILFHNRKAMDENNRGNYVINNNNNNDRRLSEEEFSILVITILRLLGHPDEYWTTESQEWVANLSRDPLHGIKLRMVLRATVLCTSYVPDALPRVEQIRVVSSLQEILLSTMMKKKTKTAAVAPTTATSNTNSPSSVTGSFDVRVEEKDLLEDPWQSFWQIHH